MQGTGDAEQSCPAQPEMELSPKARIITSFTEIPQEYSGQILGVNGIWVEFWVLSPSTAFVLVEICHR